MRTTTTFRGAVTAAWIVTALTLSGCTVSGAPDSVAAGGSGVVGQELKSLSAEELEVLLAASTEQNLVPGAFAIVTTPQGTITASAGTTEIGIERQPQASDVFRVGSVTKTMTGIVILQLADEGKLKLTDSIGTYIEGIPRGDEITIANLLNMRSGLHNYLDIDGFAAVFNTNMTHVWTPQQLIAFGLDYPAGAAPDTAFDYSNTNTNLLGLVAEQLDEKPLVEIYHDRLFKPLGMTDTELPDASRFTLPDPDVQGYQYGTFPINHGPLMPEADREAARDGTLQPNLVTEQST